MRKIWLATSSDCNVFVTIPVENPTQQEQQEEQSGEHLAERCRLLTRARSQVEGKELLEWKSRHARNKIEKKETGPVGPAEKEKEEEEKLETFFCKIHEFHNPVPVAPVFVPAELPPRYAINFVPAAPHIPVSASPTGYSVSVASDSAIPASHVSSTNYSVISSVDFVVCDPTCIETN